MLPSLVQPASTASINLSHHARMCWSPEQLLHPSLHSLAHTRQRPEEEDEQHDIGDERPGRRTPCMLAFSFNTNRHLTMEDVHGYLSSVHTPWSHGLHACARHDPCTMAATTPRVARLTRPHPARTAPRSQPPSSPVFTPKPLDSINTTR